jgi:hypothetical protein
MFIHVYSYIFILYVLTEKVPHQSNFDKINTFYQISQRDLTLQDKPQCQSKLLALPDKNGKPSVTKILIPLLAPTLLLPT